MKINFKVSKGLVLSGLLVCLLSSVQAHAWGKREQGILTGIVGTVIVSELIDSHRERNKRSNEIGYETNHLATQRYATTHRTVYPASATYVYPAPSYQPVLQNNYHYSLRSDVQSELISEAQRYYQKGVHDRLRYEQYRYNASLHQVRRDVRTQAYRCGRYGDC